MNIQNSPPRKTKDTVTNNTSNHSKSLLEKVKILIANPSLSEADKRELYSAIQDDMEKANIPLTDKEINNLTDKAQESLNNESK